MAKRFSSDRILFAVTLSLVFFGLLMVISSSAILATDQYGSPHTFFWKQLAWAAMGIVAMLSLMRLDYRRLRHPAVLFPAFFSPSYCWRPC